MFQLLLDHIFLLVKKRSPPVVGILCGCLLSEVVVIGWTTQVGADDMLCCCRSPKATGSGILGFSELGVLRLERCGETFCFLGALTIGMLGFTVGLLASGCWALMSTLVRCLL